MDGPNVLDGQEVGHTNKLYYERTGIDMEGISFVRRITVEDWMGLGVLMDYYRWYFASNLNTFICSTLPRILICAIS